MTGHWGPPMVEPRPVVKHMRKRTEFLAAAKAPFTAVGAVLVQMRARHDGETEIRLGFTATKKIGGAVVRNRAKRRLREAARAAITDLGQGGCDYVFVARQGAPDRPFELLLKDVRHALERLASGRGQAPNRRPT